jgi:hypothetical protein
MNPDTPSFLEELKATYKGALKIEEHRLHKELGLILDEIKATAAKGEIEYRKEFGGVRNPDWYTKQLRGLGLIVRVYSEKNECLLIVSGWAS